MRESKRVWVAGVMALCMTAGCGVEGADEPVGQAAAAVEGRTSVVSPILLVPQGSNVTETQLLQLRQGLENVRLWYQRELPSKDVRWEKLRVLRGQQTAAHYVVDNNVWAEIPGEIQQAFGWNPWDDGVDPNGNHIALVIGRDLQGWAGGAGYPEGRGLAILGLESLVDQAACAPEWWCTQEFWHGTAIHELGHGFTLPHDDDPMSIMAFHGEYKQRYFVAEHRAVVEANPAAGPKGPAPIAAWSFDTCAGSGEAPDESGGGNRLLLENGATCAAGAGLIEGAGRFDGADDIAETLGGGLNVGEALTLVAWVKPDRVTGVQTIVNKWYAMDSYGLAIDEGDFVFSVAFPGGDWGRVVSVRAPGAVVGKWTHVAAVYTGRQIRLYVDGKLKGNVPARGRLQASERPVAVGNHPSWNAFAGAIDQLRVYDAALKPAEIFPY